MVSMYNVWVVRNLMDLESASRPISHLKQAKSVNRPKSKIESLKMDGLPDRARDEQHHRAAINIEPMHIVIAFP